MVAFVSVTAPHLPLPLETARAVLAAGAIVLLVVAYDYYRHRSEGPE